MDKISDKEAAMVFTQGAEEIERMRLQMSILQAKAEVIDVFKMALSGERPQGQGYGEDVAWKMRQAAKAIASRSQNPAEGSDTRRKVINPHENAD